MRDREDGRRKERMGRKKADISINNHSVKVNCCKKNNQLLEITAGQGLGVSLIQGTHQVWACCPKWDQYPYVGGLHRGCGPAWR